MRLIDADALYANIGHRHMFSGESVGGFINNSPTIDAIPVEWLQKYTAVGVTPRGGRLTEGNERLIVHRILNDWQHEQEAQDG